jgi:glycosyltransferase involved in cell wall biosynthesis
VRFDWEYGALPRALADTLAHQVDEVWTHSRAVAATCASGGVPPERVRIVPHGVDPRRFRPGLPPLPEIAERTRGDQVILFVGEAIWRKGIDLLLSAYGRAFTARDRVVLVVKEMGSGTSYEGFSLSNAVARLAACAGAPRILHLTEPIPGDRMGSLYAAADVLVHPYRGEGFGLPVLEARACGIPVLVTRGGATDDFTAGEACVHVGAARRTIALPEPTVGPPWVLEPDLDELIAGLRLVLDRSAWLSERALAAAPSVTREFSWDRAAQAVAACAHGMATGSREPVLAGR